MSTLQYTTSQVQYLSSPFMYAQLVKNWMSFKIYEKKMSKTDCIYLKEGLIFLICCDVIVAAIFFIKGVENPVLFSWLFVSNYCVVQA